MLTKRLCQISYFFTVWSLLLCDYDENSNVELVVGNVRVLKVFIYDVQCSLGLFLPLASLCFFRFMIHS